ncbi:MAG: enoyl-CoA hydratase/isomerase family protein [Deltaproteobacteria bacterium]|nr:enoyl-CoA hydratase/isomerase family protein [Deltaproteobacteria bacterium]
MNETLIYEIKEQTAIITLARPKLLNALDQESSLELVQALEEAGSDQKVRTIILTGQGRAFSAGGNVRGMLDHLEKNPGQGASAFFRRVVDLLNRSVLAIRQAPKPVLAAVNGVAAGGGLGWVLASDLILATPRARFDAAYIRIAINPDGGNTFFLPRFLGPWRASELFFLGQALTAEEALNLGLVNRLTAEENLMDEALSLARELAGKSAQVLARTKALINASAFAGLAGQLELEREAILASADEPDFEAGIRAFFDKKSALKKPAGPQGP